MAKEKTVLINLLAIARYEHAPDYPIQFMTVGNLNYTNPDEVLLEYVESQQDDETGEIMKAEISLHLQKGKITMERKGDYSSTMVFSRDRRFEGKYKTPYGDMDMAVALLAMTVSSESGRNHPMSQRNVLSLLIRSG